MNDTDGNKVLYTLFKEKNFTPNDSQLKAILHTDGPLFLTAGPGSGKTRVLLWRTLNLIVFHGIRPDEIFLSTFTEKAALQLKQGLQGLLSIASEYTHQPYDIAEMYVGTLHSLCQKLLSDRRFTQNRNRTHRPIVLDELDQYFFVRAHWTEILAAGGFTENRDDYSKINQWFGSRTSGSKTTAIKNLVSFFARMSEEDFDDSLLHVAVGIEEPSPDTENALFAMTKEYRTLLSADSTERVDFACLQQKAYAHISQGLVSGEVFKHVIVDEYQDTNTIQQKIYLQLARGNKNICVVGDDDQALYRFRGATVENLVDFENICNNALGVRPLRIDLNTNYRSRAQIVRAYTDFIAQADWEDKSKPNTFFRIQNKQIQAASTDTNSSVLVETGCKETCAENIVAFVKKLKETGKISDYNQCAFLFPTLRGNYDGMSAGVKTFADAFTKAGIPYYAPRAKSILYTEEFLAVFGLFAKVLKISASPDTQQGSMKKFHEWLQAALVKADTITAADNLLEQFIIDKWTQIEIVKNNYKILKDYCEERGIHLEKPAYEQTARVLAAASGLAVQVKNELTSTHLNTFIQKRANEGNPVNGYYVLSRVTALDWTLLDLFYQLNFFKYFEEKYELAERGGEDSALYNLGMITQYLSRFMEINNPILSGRSFQEESLSMSLFNSFLYTLSSLGETELEDADDPFPKGCVPFLTVHQSKGLEFPVVVLGSVRHAKHAARPLDVLVRQMMKEQNALPNICEPLDSMDEYDTMRLFYVALSRAKNLAIIACVTGRGSANFDAMKTFLAKTNFKDTTSFDMDTMPKSTEKTDELTRVYTYTGDYLPYKNCPRNYMVFHKYDFVPSRSQTMFFGSLVHQSVEDLENFLNGGLI